MTLGDLYNQSLDPNSSINTRLRDIFKKKKKTLSDDSDTAQRNAGGSGYKGGSVGDSSGYGTNIQPEAADRIVSNSITPEINSTIVDKPQGLGDITPKLDTKITYGISPSPVVSSTPLVEENKTTVPPSPSPTPTQQPTPSYKFSTSGPNGSTLNISDENNKSLGYISRMNGEPAIVPEVRDASGNRVMNQSMADALSSHPTRPLGFTKEGLAKIHPETPEERANRERDAAVVAQRRADFDRVLKDIAISNNQRLAAEQAAYMNRPDVISAIAEQQQNAINQRDIANMKLGQDQAELTEKARQFNIEDTTKNRLGEMEADVNAATLLGNQKYKERQAEMSKRFTRERDLQRQTARLGLEVTKNPYGMDATGLAKQYKSIIDGYIELGYPEEVAYAKVGMKPPNKE